ncbi:hypothetical protein GCM10027053_47350 [Intrasporangium mesophilum]
MTISTTRAARRRHLKVSRAAELMRAIDDVDELARKARAALDELELGIDRVRELRNDRGLALVLDQPERFDTSGQPLSIPEAMLALGISRSTIDRWVRDGVIETVAFGARQRIPRREIDRLRGQQ